MSDQQIPPTPPPQQPPYPPQPPYYYPPRRRSRWWIPLLVIGILLFIFIGGLFAFLGLLGNSFKEKTVNVKNGSVLVMDFDRINEESRHAPIAIFGNEGKSSVSLFEAIRALNLAKTDDRIRGIYIKDGGSNFGMAIGKEVQDALFEFKKSGKFIYAFIETGSKQDYYNVLPADSIFMPREGMLEFQNYGSTSMFFKNMFDKIGVDFYVQQFEEYKSAGEMFSRTGHSEPAREELRALLDQRLGYFLDGVSKARKVPADQVKAAMDRGVYAADSLLALRLIDGIASEGNVRERIKSRIGQKNNAKKDKNDEDEDEDDEELRTISLTSYVSSSSFRNANAKAKDKTIAIIYGSGPITTGRNDSSPFGSDESIASESYVKMLREAREDEDVDGIILRINSPGGSVIASDAIYEEIVKTRKIKPVYASMSDVAASGGYYMAVACDTIIAHPATITGSIGVILSIPNLSKGIDKLGITIDTVSTGRSAYFMNPAMAFSEQDKQKLYTMSKGIYDRFLEKVAQGRRKSYEEIRQVARGRVWTGDAASQHGLVDVQGGLMTSINTMKQRLGVKTDELVKIEIYPHKKEPIEELLKMFGMGEDEDDEDNSGNGSIVIAASKLFRQDEASMLRMWTILPEPVRRQLMHAITLARISEKENVVAAMPYHIEMK